MGSTLPPAPTPPAASADAPLPAGGPDPAALSIEDARHVMLVKRYLAGDRDALEEVLVSIQPRLLALCAHISGDPAHARDLCQEAMVRIIQGLPGFAGNSRLSTWMIRVTTNVCLTDRRRAKVRKTASLDAPRPRGDEGQGTSNDLADRREPGAPARVEQRDSLSRLSGALAQIDAEQRALLILRDAQGLDYADIAELLGVPVGTIKSRIFRARQALRLQLEAGGYPSARGEA